MLYIAKDLQLRGHRVIYTGSAAFGPLVTARGFEFETAYGAEPPLGQEVSPSSSAPSGREGMRAWMACEAEALRNLREWLAETKVNLAIIDPLLSPPFIIPYLEHGIPLVAANTTLSSKCSFHYAPVFSPRVPSPSGARDLPLNFAAWTGLRMRGLLSRSIRRGLADPTHRSVMSWAQVGSRFGLSIGWSEYGERMLLPEIVLGPSSFDFPRRLPVL